ncbi:hypothetical protein BASA60_002602 [Batrachochytrium salamandrivorans]|nr:hypothetical protein BASA60_002602 [Batrachochytrium salamandrivorans]
MHLVLLLPILSFARALKPSSPGGSSNDGPSDEYLALLVLKANVEDSSLLFRNAKFILDQAQAYLDAANRGLQAYLKDHPDAKPETNPILRIVRLYSQCNGVEERSRKFKLT